MAEDERVGRDEGRRLGFSRRGFLGGTAGGVTAAVVLGAGVAPASASAAEPTTPAAVGPLRAADPHARRGRSTSRRRPARSGGPTRVRILPIERATFQAGALFDLRVEAGGVDLPSTRLRVEVTGDDGPVALLRPDPVRTSAAPDGLEATFVAVAYPDPGCYTVRATVTSTAGEATGQVRHEVLIADTGARRAKNVIFFLGDGMGTPAITAARILSRGLTEGKYHSLLEMDRMDFRGNVTTSGADSIATDSANSMSAYMTGHKSSVSALGVYASNAAANDAHPRVETMTELVKRVRGMSVGVVSTAEIQDATPAAVFAHTRERDEYADIMDQALRSEQQPDVLLGGGLASLIPRSRGEDSEREDERDLVAEFRSQGFTYVDTATALRETMAAGTPDKLLGTFTYGNMDVYLDRAQLRDPEVLEGFTDQPTLMQMTEAALEVLRHNDDGFFLMVEGASIDKMEHPQDGPRAVYDAIELDQAVGVAKRWAAEHGDTLIVVTADHNHSMSIVGTHDRRPGAGPGREGNGVYEDAGFPTYRDSDGDGFPDDPNPDVALFYGWSNHPDHTDDFQLDPTPQNAAMVDARDVAVPNPAKDPGAELQTGNLPRAESQCVHTVEDVSIFASGPGAHRFNALLDNTEVFHRIIDALGLVASDRQTRRLTREQTLTETQLDATGIRR